MISLPYPGIGGGAGILSGNLLAAGELEKTGEYGGRLPRLAILIGCPLLGSGVIETMRS